MIISLLIILAIASWIVFRLRRNGINLIESASHTQNEFNAISNPGRHSSEEELNTFLQKQENLVLAINHFLKYYRWTLNTADRQNLDSFSHFFKEIQTVHRKNNEIHAEILNIEKWVDFATYTLSHFYKQRYFCASDKELFWESEKEHIDKFIELYTLYKGFFTNKNCDIVFGKLLNITEERKNHNKEITRIELEKNRDFFDTALPYPLDLQQREAIVSMEDNTLVISSAGSGKTATIIGKAKYLLDICHIDPRRLLILTYTRKAAAELSQRLNNAAVKCSTFHSLALQIIAETDSRKPSICDNALLLNVFNNLLESNSSFKQAILHYILHQQSLMKLEHEYDNAPNYFADRKKYGIRAPYPDMRGNIIFTKSEEEKRICTYLSELGVPFLYEEPYPIETYTQEYRQYYPDFTIFCKDEVINPTTGIKTYRERRVYLEHFAIDANGKVPKWFGDKDISGGWFAQNLKYNEGIKWKRELHKRYHTTLIETTSADFHSQNILEVLKEKLRKANVPIRPVSTELLYSYLVNRSRHFEDSVFKMLERFIVLLKSDCGSIQPLIDKAVERNDKRTIAILKDIANPLLQAYQAKLRERKEIDFTDAILKATNYCATNPINRFDYILVDEFQDISTDRYSFLQYLRTQHPLTKLFCVGDDWQSIYRFAGSNMKLFYKFEEFFGYTNHCKIETTYRLFEPLLSLSSNFITRNPQQVAKDVKPVSQSRLTTYEFHTCGDSRDKTGTLQKLSAIVASIPQSDSILILGRYNYDAISLGIDFNTISSPQNQNRIVVNISGRNVTFMSVHSAKGLEADHVILINCDHGPNGFPSLIEDDPILSYVLSEEDQFEHAEERRLFYVALTRAKKKMYILFHSNKPSVFVRELTKSETTESPKDLCPVCKDGHVIALRHGIASNGNHYVNYGCTNAEIGCDYFIRKFYNKNKE